MVNIKKILIFTFTSIISFSVFSASVEIEVKQIGSVTDISQIVENLKALSQNGSLEINTTKSDKPNKIRLQVVEANKVNIESDLYLSPILKSPLLIYGDPASVESLSKKIAKAGIRAEILLISKKSEFETSMNELIPDKDLYLYKQKRQIYLSNNPNATESDIIQSIGNQPQNNINHDLLAKEIVKAILND